MGLVGGNDDIFDFIVLYRQDTYWASVIFAPMEEYEPKLKFGPRDIPVIATPNPLLQKAAKWIKENMGTINVS